MMFKRLKMLARITSLYLKRQKALDLLKQLETSDLSDDTRNGIIHIMRSMRIIREADVQRANSCQTQQRGAA
jgi:hypothetical protein